MESRQFRLRPQRALPAKEGTPRRPALRTLDPTGVLKRGYSILLDQRKRAIRKAEDAPRGTRLHALLGEGSLTLAVEESQTAIPQPPTP